MDILFYGSVKDGRLEGPAVHIYEVLNGLSKLGHNIVTLGSGFFGDKAEADTTRPLSTWTRVKGRVSRSRTLKPVIGELSLLSVLLTEIHVFMSALIIVARRRGKFDVVYGRHTLFNSEYLLTKLFKIPSVKEVNGIVADEAKITKRGDRISLRIIDRIERFNMPRADKIIVVTSKLKEVLQKDYGVPGDKIVVVPNGANTDLFKPMDVLKAREELGLNQSDNYICFVGSLVQWQGVEYLIKSIPLILKRWPETQFLVVGDGPMKQELIELAEQVGISAKVMFTGMVPYQKIPLYMNASDVCVLPKKPMRTGYSPLKLCEYMACMKPVVATRTDGFEILEEFKAGVLMNPENPSEFAQAIIKLLQKPELRRKMGRNGRKYVVENRSWESVAKRVADVCEAAIMSYQRK